MSLDGRLAIVTGGASGIGAGICEMLARAGALVVVADIDGAGAAARAEALLADGHRAALLQVDLADEASILAGCRAVFAAHGAPWLLVNNAGLQSRELLLEGSAAHWDAIVAVNARGAFLMTRECGRAMAGAKAGGRIVNVASAALIGSLIMGLSAYTASKGAMLGLSMASALELAPHAITVNTVLPGGVGTPGAINAGGGSVPAEGPTRRAPLLGRCEPADIAAAVLFFASPAARFVTNQVLAVDAGWSLS